LEFEAFHIFHLKLNVNIYKVIIRFSIFPNNSDSQPPVWRQCKVFESTSSGVLDLQFGVFGTSLKLVSLKQEQFVFSCNMISSCCVDLGLDCKYALFLLFLTHELYCKHYLWMFPLSESLDFHCIWWPTEQFGNLSVPNLLFGNGRRPTSCLIPATYWNWNWV